MGSKQTMNADVRFVAATNRDLLELVQKGLFREDFYYRLNVFPVKLPPLRERREDIPALAQHFLKKYSAQTGKAVEHISAEAMRLLLRYGWPGNVRELENAIHRAVILAGRESIEEKDILIEEGQTAAMEGKTPAGGPGPSAPRTAEELKQARKKLREQSVEQVEKDFVIGALDRNGWNVSRAAQEVGMERPNFHALMKKYGVKKRG